MARPVRSVPRGEAYLLIEGLGRVQSGQPLRGKGRGNGEVVRLGNSKNPADRVGIQRRNEISSLERHDMDSTRALVTTFPVGKYLIHGSTSTLEIDLQLRIITLRIITIIESKQTNYYGIQCLKRTQRYYVSCIPEENRGILHYQWELGCVKH